jgi:hypothetical protein
VRTTETNLCSATILPELWDVGGTAKQESNTPKSELTTKRNIWVYLIPLMTLLLRYFGQFAPSIE